MKPRHAQALLSASVAIVVLSTSGCGSGESRKEKPAASASPAAAPEAALTPVDACSLLAKTEVEAIVGKSVMEASKEQAGNLATCSYGDPAAPKIGDRPMTQVLTLSLFTGEGGSYYAGAVAQAKDAYEMAREHAAAREAVSGLGESAYWDATFHSLTAYKGRYWISVDLESTAGLEIAKTLLDKAIERLP